MNKDIYIHYGHKYFDANLFMEINNFELGHVKPHGGLWASNINAKYGWKEWCRENNFRKCSYDDSFKFKLKSGTKVLRIDKAKTLKELPIIDSPYKFSWINLDFEKIKENYDAIEVLISADHQLYWDLYGWDCDSLLILNKDCIELI